jgi:phosphoglycolate phosphatase-like HAD superfamily hydrolase
MNYDHLNTVYEFWRKDILPHLSHSFNVDSFNEYLKRFAFLPSGKWLRDMEKIKLNRIGFAVDCKKLVKELKDKCVAYNAPMKPEDGLQRIIYQISPTLHIEVAVWIWMEQKELQQYASVFAAYNDEQEFLEWVDDIYKRMRKKGNTEDTAAPGFAELVKSLHKPS